MNTLNEPHHDRVHYALRLNNRGEEPVLMGSNWLHALNTSLESPGTYLLAPVAKVVEVEIPGEAVPVEPYVGLEWRHTNHSLPRRKVVALFSHSGQEYIVLDQVSGPTCYPTKEVKGWENYPTTTTPPRTEKRLVMLNGWTREGFGESV
jgi:hypothetical protein